MFYYIEGTVTELGSYLAVLDCGGVGFELNVSLNTLSRLKTGERARLYVAESVKEDAFDLFGFATKSEKRFFQLLIGVSGVGPKAALSILSSSTTETLAMAILAGDEKALTVAPGVGKKIAQRVIYELQDKIAKESGASPRRPRPAGPPRPGLTSSLTPRRRLQCSDTARRRLTPRFAGWTSRRWTPRASSRPR